MLKSAIAGCGGIASVHARVLGEMNNAGWSCRSGTARPSIPTLASCCDEKPGRAVSFAEKHGCTPYASLKELIDADKPDVLHICAPHYAHAPLAIYAMRRGVHVLCEKPVAASLPELTALENAASGSNAQLGVCFQNRFNPSVVYVKGMLESGETGRITAARAILTWSRGAEYFSGSDWRGAKNTEGTSVLLNQAIHTVDLFLHLLGEPERVAGSVSNRGHGGIISTEDTAEAALYYGGGLKALLYASICHGRDSNLIVEINCENMSFCMEGDRLRVTSPDGSELPAPDLEALSPLGKPYWGGGHRGLINGFYECLQSGERFPIDVIEGGKAVKTVFEIIAASS